MGRHTNRHFKSYLISPNIIFQLPSQIVCPIFMILSKINLISQYEMSIWLLDGDSAGFPPYASPHSYQVEHQTPNYKS